MFPSNFIKEFIDWFKKYFIIILSFTFSASLTIVLFVRYETRDYAKRIEVLEEALQRADQSCADLEARYNSDVAKYWNQNVRVINGQNDVINKHRSVLNAHADMLNDIEARLKEVEKRRFF